MRRAPGPFVRLLRMMYMAGISEAPSNEKVRALSNER